MISVFFKNSIGRKRGLDDAQTRYGGGIGNIRHSCHGRCLQIGDKEKMGRI